MAPAWQNIGQSPVISIAISLIGMGVPPSSSVLKFNQIMYYTILTQYVSIIGGFEAVFKSQKRTGQ